jgi:hypothetical protein
MKIRSLLPILPALILPGLTLAQKPEDKKAGWYMDDMARETNARWQRQEEEERAKERERRARASSNSGRENSGSGSPGNPGSGATGSEYSSAPLDPRNSISQYAQGKFEPGWHVFNEGWGLIDSNRILVSPIFYEVYARENYPAVVTVASAGGKFDGVVDAKGKYLLQPIYKMIFTASGILHLESTDRKWGMADIHGKIIANTEYDNIYPTGDYFAAGKAGKFIILDKTGNKIVPTGYDFIKSAGDYFFAGNGNKFGVVDHSAKEIVPLEFDSLKSSGAFFETFLGAKRGLFENTGRKIEIPDFHDLETYNSRFTAYRNKERKIGIVDRAGISVVAPKYDSIYAIGLSEKGHPGDSALIDKGAADLYEVRIGSAKAYKAGLLDGTGKEIIPPVFGGLHIENDRVFGFANEAGKNGEKTVSTSIYDYVGNKIFGPIQYELTATVHKEFYLATSGKKMGLVSDKGEVLIKPDYDYVDFSEYKGLVLVGNQVKGGAIRGLFSETGKAIVAPQRIGSYDEMIEIAKRNGAELILR